MRYPIQVLTVVLLSMAVSGCDTGDGHHFNQAQEDSLLVGDYLFGAKGVTDSIDPNVLLHRSGRDTAYAQRPNDGTHTYDIAFAEWEGKSMGAQCDVIISGDSIRVIYNGVGSLTAPKGHVLDAGLIMKHKSGLWIIAHNAEDVNALEVGGCGSGPSVIDFDKKKWWTC